MNFLNKITRDECIIQIWKIDCQMNSYLRKQAILKTNDYPIFMAAIVLSILSEVGRDANK